MAWNIDLSPNAVRRAKEKMRKEEEEDRMSGFNYTISEDGTKRYEGVPFRFDDDGNKKYFPELAPPGSRSPDHGLLGPNDFRKPGDGGLLDGLKRKKPEDIGTPTPERGVIRGRGPNAGKTPPLIVDEEFIRQHRQGQYRGPANNPPGRMPLN